jgi:hypothetical protein
VLTPVTQVTHKDDIENEKARAYFNRIVEHLDEDGLVEDYTVKYIGVIDCEGVETVFVDAIVEGAVMPGINHHTYSDILSVKPQSEQTIRVEYSKALKEVVE